MDIQTLIEQGKKEQVPIEALRAVAGNSAAFGQDIVEVFSGQAERRAVAAGTLLTTAEGEQRDLLASEQRGYDRMMREAEAVRSLQRDVEARTQQRIFVPMTQVIRTETRSGEVATVLAGEQRMADWLQQRGGYAYQGDHDARTMRFGAFVAALATGNRSHLTDLERRALAEGVDASGGFTVPEVVGARFLDRVRDALVVQRAGAQIVPMTSDTLHLARVAQPGIETGGSPSVNAAIGAWKAENDLIDESDLTLERVTFTARTLPLLLKMSVELFEDSTNISEIVEREMARSTALELDRVALVGSGTPPEPRGILNQSGVQTDTLGTPTNWDFLIDAAGLLWTENHEPNAAIYGTTTAIELAKFKSTADDQPLVMASALSGLRQFRTNAAEGYVFVGDFTQLLIGMRTGFRIEVSRTGAGAFERLQVAVRSYIRADVALAHPEAFLVLS